MDEMILEPGGSIYNLFRFEVVFLNNDWFTAISVFYPVRNNAPLLPPGQRLSLRGRSPSWAEPGPAAAAGLHFRLIPAGFNAPPEFLTGFTEIFFLDQFRYFEFARNLCLTKTASGDLYPVLRFFIS